MLSDIPKPYTVLLDWRDSASGVTDTTEFLFFCTNESEAIKRATEDFTLENKQLGYDCCKIKTVDAVLTENAGCVS
jgi:hypothetical protein